MNPVFTKVFKNQEKSVSMKKYYSLLLIINLLLSCSEKPTEPEYLDFEGESYPIGPLRVVDSKIKTEIVYRMNTSELLESTEYQYYPDGLLRTKKRTNPDLTIYTITHYYYDHSANLIKEIVLDGNVSSDTIFYRYNSLNQLIQKETIHSSSYFVLRDTVFYQYDQEGNLIAWKRKDPYSQYATVRSEKYQYTNGLLTKVCSYENENLLWTYEYQYYNRIKTRELTYSGSGILSGSSIYYYHDGLLKMVKSNEIYSLSNKRVGRIYFYNNQYELIIQKVYVPGYSSYVDHEIHYKYY